jgi:hypothetical protein
MPNGNGLENPPLFLVSLFSRFPGDMELLCLRADLYRVSMPEHSMPDNASCQVQQ